MACGKHATELEKAVAKASGEAHWQGHREGYESGGRSAQATIRRLEERVAALEAELDEKRRVFELDGDQIVQVDGYTYRWGGGIPLGIGDVVLLPENWLSKVKNGAGSFEGVVTELGSTYRGDISRIVRRVRPASP